MFLTCCRMFFGGACLSFCESLPLVSRNQDLSFWKSKISHFGNPRPLILEIQTSHFGNPDLSFWKSQISLFGRSGPLSIGIRRSRAVSGCRHLCRTG